MLPLNIPSFLSARLALLQCFPGLSISIFYVVESNRYAEQLYEDLLYYYNKNVRPVKNASESIKVKFGASLIRIIDVVSFSSKYGNKKRIKFCCIQ